QDVSARLFLEGRAAEARTVLAGGPPTAESREHAAALLRDLKAVLLGEGKVSTAAVADVVAPEGKAGDGKQPVRQSPLTDLGPAAEAERLEGKLEGRVEAEVRQARKNGEEQTRFLARQIQTHLRSLR